MHSERNLKFKKPYKYLLCASILAATTFVFAQDNDASAIGLFVEPAVTYETSASSITYPSPLSASSGKIEGFGVGARLGIHLVDVFFAGLDARYSMPQFEDSSTTYSAKAVGHNWGPVVGMQMPIVGLRVWGSYILGGEMNPEKSGSLDVKFSGATGYRVGTGFRIAMVSLNLEYQDLKYGQTTLEQIGPFAVDSNFDNVNLNNKSWIASVSFPFDF